MKQRFIISALTGVAMIGLISTVATAFPTQGPELRQISGIGYYPEQPGECNDPEGQGSDYAFVMNGSLEGCTYIFVETSRCSPSGAYYESGTETFVGLYGSGSGTFRTNYVFTAKYQNCITFVGQVNGRCQHPVIDGSGTGVFEGVRGRFDMKDDIEEGNFPYRGHLIF